MVVRRHSPRRLVRRSWNFATDPAYRSWRGPISCSVRSHPSPAATALARCSSLGIPWYYRQFGYEYALSPRPSSHACASATNRSLPDVVSARVAMPVDVDFLAGVDGAACRASPFLRYRDVATWQLEPTAEPACSELSRLRHRRHRGRHSPRSIGYVIHQNHAWGPEPRLCCHPGTRGSGLRRRSWPTPKAWRGQTAWPGITLAGSAEHPALDCLRRWSCTFGGHYGLYVGRPTCPASSARGGARASPRAHRPRRITR